MAKKYEIDMSEGPLTGKILRFAFPLMLSGMLQLLFNAADTVVVGRFAGSDSLAAVGTTGSLINLIVNLFMGFSVGANVLAARYYGSRDEKNLRETVHTSILVSLLGGILFGVIGFILAPPMLRLMGTPENVLPKSVMYMRIYFAGLPFTGMYNFGAAILRSVGDTKRPLYFLSFAGVINIFLNLFFVIVLHMDVAGVAVATVISNAIAVTLVMITLIRSNTIYSVKLKELRIHKNKLIALARVGIPAGIQGTVFSISNVVIQSSINSFGATVMAGSTASANIEGFVYIALNAFHHAALAATSQSVGAGRLERVGKTMRVCAACVTLVGAVMGVLLVLFREPLISIYSSDPQVIAVGMNRLIWVGTPYFLCGLMDMMVGCLRGMGYSVMPTVVSLLGACGSRIIWVYTVFALVPTLDILYLSYLASWALTAGVHLICYFCVRKRFIARNTKQPVQQPA